LCPSITFVNSVKTSNRILRCFHPEVGQTILVFTYETNLVAIFRRDPVTVRRMQMGQAEIAILRQYLASQREPFQRQVQYT